MGYGLRAWRLEDAPALREAIDNKNIQNNLRDGLPCPYTLRDAEEYIQTTLAAPEGSQYAFAITADDAAIGSIGVFRQGNIHRQSAEMGYYIAQPYWGKGIGTWAVTEACRRAFENTDLLRIFAEPFATNAASCRVLEKAGFALEGILRKNAVKNGVILDMKLYAKVRE
ncbi:MAG: GNAT family N-acetyltransferase [Christensenellaceae bacterium]|nr:GNAT family N-acetyltransferase [Christensenellaceae bacterium]